MLRTVIACAVMIGAPAALADTLLLDGIDAARSSADLRPARGISMDRVEAQFGPPAMRQSAVGDPPIERWEYPGFGVYFEHQYVIHSVVTP